MKSLRSLSALSMILAIGLTFVASHSAVAKEPGLLFAHRGGAHEFEENTLPAFQASYEKGLRGFETDVRMTRDGKFVILHDDNLERTHSGEGHVEELTAGELKTVKSKKSGLPLLFLDDLLEEFADKPGVYFEFEMKTGNKDLYPDARLEEYCRRLLETLAARKPEGSQYVLTSFDKRPLKLVKQIAPEADILLIVSNGKCTDAEVSEAQSLGATRIGVRIDKVTRAEVVAAQKAGLRVSCWPGQSVQDYQLAVGLGVDAICCDIPIAIQTWKEQHEK